MQIKPLIFFSLWLLSGNLVATPTALETPFGTLYYEDALSAGDEKSKIIFKGQRLWEDMIDRLYFEQQKGFRLNGQSARAILFSSGPGNRQCPAMWKLVVITHSYTGVSPTFGDCIQDGPAELKTNEKGIVVDLGMEPHRQWQLNHHGQFYPINHPEKGTLLW